MVVGQVLDAHVKLADAGGGNKRPDGQWEKDGRSAVLEVTSPPAQESMKEFARATRCGQQHVESGNFPAHPDGVGPALTRLLREEWALDNIDKLNAIDADERHLYLLARTVEQREHFSYGLSDRYEDGDPEPVADLELPDGLTDVWFEGRAFRGDDRLDGFNCAVARFNRDAGWSRHEVHVAERTLPAPDVVDDPAPGGWRLDGPAR